MSDVSNTTLSSSLTSIYTSFNSLPTETIWAGAAIGLEAVASIGSFAIDLTVNVAIREFSKFEDYYHGWKNLMPRFRLITAVQSGNLNAVQQWLQQGRSVNAPIIFGSTMLHFAAQSENEDMLRFLIDQGANLNAKNVNGQTPIHVALQSRRLKLANILMDRGADMKVEDIEGKTPLQLLAAYKATPTIIHREGRSDLPVFTDGEPPIIRAMRNKDDRLVQQLVQLGADLNAVGETDYTPLDWAAKNGNKEMMKYLIDHGAKLIPNDSPEYSCTALELYVPKKDQYDDRQEFRDLLIFLFKGQNPDDARTTLLDLRARGARHTHMRNAYIDCLNEVVGGINTQYTNGDTLLHIFCRENDEEGVKYLIDTKAAIGIKNDADQTPIDLTTNNNIKQLLKDAAQQSIKGSKR